MQDSAGTTTSRLDAIRREQEDTSSHLPARYAGVLIHPTSLPGPYGSGDLGQGVFDLLDWLALARVTRWQVLPLGPTGYGDSPYQCFSAFAGNPVLIGLDSLVADGLLTPDDLSGASFSSNHVDYGAVLPWRMARLRLAAERFREHPDANLRQEYSVFRAEQITWLEDYALFMALKGEHDGHSWLEWPEALRLRERSALAEARERLAAEVDIQRFLQFLFFRQWNAVRQRANALGIRIIGDIPIFVALDSADVWANPHLFQLHPSGEPRAVAGVPPDYFSATGQLWGNPLYDWEALEQTGYLWWIERFRAIYRTVDIVRVDHFRGFEAYWTVSYGETTAIRGRWEGGPGSRMFDAVRSALGHTAVIAEDLGVITDAVEQLRVSLGFPGMKVLQFAFGFGDRNVYLPHHHTIDSVVYSGTHDNDTSVGWYANTEDSVRDHLRRYLSVDGNDVAWDLIRCAMQSVAETAVVPAQDILSLGSEARMNLPGSAGGNWGWRVQPGALGNAHAARLRNLIELYGRTG